MAGRRAGRAQRGDSSARRISIAPDEMAGCADEEVIMKMALPLAGKLRLDISVGGCGNRRHADSRRPTGDDRV